MHMIDLIYSVQDIFTNFLKDNNYDFFNIPDYQRGYKWNASDATKMLNDLKKFEDSNPKDDDFYCLQNITLVPNTDKKAINVVDGQQRLTTLYILLSFLKNYKNNNEACFSPEILQYSIRNSTASKLKELNTNKDWDEITPSLAEHRDEFYILTVAKAIYDWFYSKDEKGERIEKNNISFDTVWKKLKLIVNIVGDKSEETIFANINGGKVSLDGADLVRAILMTKSAKEKFIENNTEKKTNEFRVRMGIEIDNINQWWSNKDVMTYYSQFLSGKIQNDELFSKAFPINLLYKLFYEVYKNDTELNNAVEEFSFDFFEYGTDFDGKGGNNYYEMYQKISSLHLTLKDWYSNSEIYHLLGYLFFNFKNELIGNDKITIETIWQKWNKSTTKSDFIQKLKQIISNKFETFAENINNDSEENGLKRKGFISNIENINSDWYHNDNTEKILPILDIIYYINNQKGRLNVNYLKKANEQKEHIMCQNPRKTEDGQELTVTEASNFIEALNFTEEDNEIHNELDILINKNKSEVLTPEVIDEFEKRLHDYCLNSIGNIVLLDSHVNESYGNAPHNQKVSRITSEFFGNEHYIRPFTAGVFLEKDKTKETIAADEKWHWGINEIRKNAQYISSQISHFLEWRN